MAPGPRDVVVPCRGPGHRVRLAGGRRFWAAARCPRCGSPVDPARWRRVLAPVANLRRPASGGWGPRAAWWGAAVFLAGAVTAAGLLQGLGDRWWPATVLLFGPRWILLLPLVPLVPAAAVLDRALLVPLGIAGLVVAGPVMGFRTGWRGWLTNPRPEDLTVVSFNARGGGTLVPGPGGLMVSWEADVAAFQECGPALRARIEALPDWHTGHHGSLCLVSRYPIVEIRAMDRRVFEAAGGSALVATFSLDRGGRIVRVTNIHLETPREGLELIRAGRVLAGIPVLREKSFLRAVELRRTRAWVDDQPAPRVVVGDFNTPPESRAYRSAWGDWRNAFSHVGVGMGGTRLNGWIRTRIDHVLADDAWTVTGARPGRDVGSDHLPMIAHLRLR